ncbi:MAG: trans-aconitate 2-methyltransferase [Candidatus Pristimantibacillus sp.]
MSKKVKEQFDSVAQHYDLQRRQLIPYFDEFYSTAAAWVNIEKSAPRILDLGAGTGLFSSFVRHKYPDASLTLVDLSDEMLVQARHRFAEDHKVNYMAADITALSALHFDEPFDAVISSLAIHHLSHPDKCALFNSIYNLLTDGGLFVNADQAAGTSPYFDNLYKEQWENSILQSGLSSSVIASAIERRKLDVNATVADQLQWLRQAGFAHTDNVYKHNEFCIFFSQK